MNISQHLTSGSPSTPRVQEVNDELRTRANMLTSKRVQNLNVYLFTVSTPPQRLNPVPCVKHFKTHTYASVVKKLTDSATTNREMQKFKRFKTFKTNKVGRD